MAALVLVLLITTVAGHWLMEPLLHALLGPLEFGWLPWFVLGLGAWLLAGQERP